MFSEYWWCSTQTLLRRGDKNHHNSSPHHRVITCLCCFAVYLLFSHKYFRIRICEVCSLVKILLVTFCKLSARCWLLCARQSAALKFAKSMFSLHTARVWAWLLPLPVLVSTNHLTPAGTKKRWRAPHPRVGQLNIIFSFCLSFFTTSVLTTTGLQKAV